jgi:hypothetical protein
METMDIFKTLLPITLSFLTVSCANWNSIHRQSDLSSTGAQVISVDAKQRHLVSVLQPVMNDGNIDPKISKRIVCVEPSPDVFSVYSAALEANAGKSDELQAALKLATGETGATIGLRTESIQLLRDAMYRLCEAHAAGAILQYDYSRLLAKYQKSMVTLIAISQLTGAVRPPQIVISNQAQLENSNKLYEAKTELTKADSQLKKQQGELKTLADKLSESEKALGDSYDKKCPNGKAAADADKDKCEKYKEVLTQKLTKDNEVAVSSKNVQDWQKVLDGEQARVALSNNSAATITQGGNAVVDSQAVITVAQIVRDMVNDVFMEDAIQTCLDLVKQVSDKTAKEYQAFVIEKKDRGIPIDQVLGMCKVIIETNLGSVT